MFNTIHLPIGCDIDNMSDSHIKELGQTFIIDLQNRDQYSIGFILLGLDFFEKVFEKYIKTTSFRYEAYTYHRLLHNDSVITDCGKLFGIPIYIDIDAGFSYTFGLKQRIDNREEPGIRMVPFKVDNVIQ